MADMATPKRKVLIIGLDGATFDLIRPWAKDGELPTFAQLMREGSHGELRSVLPPLTAPAWTTMVTGTNPGKHGLGDFWTRDFKGYDFRLVNASSRARPALWDVVSQHGGQVVVCNVPMTYPPTPVNGVIVSGLDTPGLDVQYTYPPELKQELNAAAGPYRIVGDEWMYGRRRQYEKARMAPFKDLETRFAAANYLLERYPWDFAMIVFTATDGVSHFFWHLMDPQHPLYDPANAERYGDTILEVYKRLDGKLAAFLQDLPEDAFLFIVSDHGNGPISDRAIYLNAWLEQKGLLRYRRGSARERWQQLLSQQLLRVLRAAKDRLYEWLPYHTRIKLEALLPGGGKRIDSLLASAQIDWSKTEAFSEEVRGSIWINLAGRDPQGIVSSGAEYEALCERILSEVHELRDPRTGEPLILRSYRREELYDGPYAHLRPDIVLEPNDTLQIFRKTDPSHPPTPVRILDKADLRRGYTTSQHLMNGILLIHGAGVRCDARLSGVEMQDIAPTVLYAMGLPIPGWMDGQVIYDALEPSYIAEHPVRMASESAQPNGQDQDSGEGYSEEEARLIEDRLRGLGYL
jgi:predicted AlkP superfamily phosphohydrolase/phosphomutase